MRQKKKYACQARKRLSGCSDSSAVTTIATWAPSSTNSPVGLARAEAGDAPAPLLAEAAAERAASAAACAARATRSAAPRAAPAASEAAAEAAAAAGGGATQSTSNSGSTSRLYHCRSHMEASLERHDMLWSSVQVLARRLTGLQRRATPPQT